MYWVDSIGRRNAFVSWGFVMGVGNRQRAVREYRGQMPSPGRPSVAWREDRVQFWQAIAWGLSSVDAAAVIEVSPA
ncbi:hypothetical protein ACFWUY_36255, partial [Streptomyces sp. NPDC058664]